MPRFFDNKPLLVICAELLGVLLLLIPGAQSFADVAHENKRYALVQRCTAAVPSRLPFHPNSIRLCQALERYRQLATQGGWPILPPGRTLRQGDRGIAVVVLQHRLRVTGDLRAWPPDHSGLFDDALEHAVRTFQKRHGLVADGMVGHDTRKALQVSVEQRLQQLALNLKRWHDLPASLGHRYILVNIPSFTLHVIEGEQAVVQMRVVVGRASRATPLFSSVLTTMVVNPAWDVPERIAIEEIVPHLRRDPAYLKTYNFKLFEGWEAEAEEIAPHRIDWSQMSTTRFPYRLHQKPGPRNTLGHIKFVVPNPFYIFLHDTPARALFRHAVRAYSHGCIRLEKPVALAEYLLRREPAWTGARLEAVMAQGLQRTIDLSEPIPVYVVYHTAWVERDGTVHFRPDIYGYDKASTEARDDAHAIPCG